MHERQLCIGRRGRTRSPCADCIRRIDLGSEEFCMRISSNLGFPRMGVRRELKKALEAYWAGKLDESGLLAVGQVLKLNHWVLQQQLGIHHIPSNDFSFYDHVLDTAAMVGAVPERYTWRGPYVDLATYFAMARGTAS